MSTALFPDTSWLVKNQHHGYSSTIFSIAYEFCNGTDITVEKSSYPRFMMYDEFTGKLTEMSEENCADMDFMLTPKTEPTTETRLAALMRFFTMILDFFTKLFKGELDFSNLLG